MVTTARRDEFSSVRKAVTAWGGADDAIEAVALVGSWARGEARMDSDADVVVLSKSDHYVTEQDWVEELFGAEAQLVRTADWGAIIERRVRLPSGFEIEFGFGEPSWAGVAPVDPGSRRVIADGCQVWYDPKDLFKQIIRAVAK